MFLIHMTRSICHAIRNLAAVLTVTEDEMHAPLYPYARWRQALRIPLSRCCWRPWAMLIFYKCVPPWCGICLHPRRCWPSGCPKAGLYPCALVLPGDALYVHAHVAMKWPCRVDEVSDQR